MNRSLFLFLFLAVIAAGCGRDDLSFVQDAETSDTFIIRAGFDAEDGVRSRIGEGSTSSQAQILWTAGDRIQVIGSTGSQYVRGVFSTRDDGVSSADFATENWHPAEGITRWYGFYPAIFGSSYAALSPSEIGLYLPTEQRAVANGFEEGLNLSWAVTDDLSSGLVFHNIPALLRFRLSGNLVSRIATIQLVTSSVIAGGCIMQGLDQAEPTLTTNRWYYYGGTGQETPSQSVTLTGPFSQDTDYYFVLYPGTSDSFSMVFADEGGNYLVKQSWKSISLTRSHITDFGTIPLNGSFGDPGLSVWTEASHGGGRPVVVCVLPEGFTAAEKDKFDALADEGLTALFQTEPFKSYKDYFTVYRMWAASRDSGASVSDGNGHIVLRRDTAFGSYWGNDSYDDMAAHEGKVFGFVTSHCPEIIAGTHSIDEVSILLVINDSRYGGKCHFFSSGRGYGMAPYTDGGEPLSWPFPDWIPASDAPMGENPISRAVTAEELRAMGSPNRGNWTNTLVHEFGGHCFGRLADEYWSNAYWSEGDLAEHAWQVPARLNISGHYTPVPWQNLLERKASLEAADPHYGRIGTFQGGGTSIFNRWRSEMVSCMIDNRFYFSTWQRMLIVKRILSLCGETFDDDAFFLKDVTDDPAREGIAPSSVHGPVRLMPPLPPPDITDNTSGGIPVR